MHRMLRYRIYIALLLLSAFCMLQQMAVFGFLPVRFCEGIIRKVLHPGRHERGILESAKQWHEIVSLLPSNTYAGYAVDAEMLKNNKAKKQYLAARYYTAPLSLKMLKCQKNKISGKKAKWPLSPCEEAVRYPYVLGEFPLTLSYEHVGNVFYVCREDWAMLKKTPGGMCVIRRKE